MKIAEYGTQILVNKDERYVGKIKYDGPVIESEVRTRKVRAYLRPEYAEAVSQLMAFSAPNSQR